MKTTFAETYFFLAMLNVRDSSHGKSVALSESLVGRIVTTQWVLVEVGDAFAKPQDRDRCVDSLKLLETDERFEVVLASDALFKRGAELFVRRPDKSWPLTDCISFVVMEERSIKEALTGDHHFAQAGFVPLLSAN